VGSQIGTDTENGLNEIASPGFSYVGGNLTADPTRSFSYDAENRLLTGSAPTPVTLAYDPLGRLQSSATAGAVWGSFVWGAGVWGGGTTTFLDDGTDLVGEYDGATLLRRYVPSGLGPDSPLLWYEGSGETTPRWLHADDQGSIVAWSDAGGDALAQAGYDPYGLPDAATGWTSPPRYRYTGQTTIPEADLYDYKARMYDPATGRFLQTDPLGQASDVNLYAYVRNDPVTLEDPFGLTYACGGGGTSVPSEGTVTTNVPGDTTVGAITVTAHPQPCPPTISPYEDNGGGVTSNGFSPGGSFESAPTGAAASAQQNAAQQQMCSSINNNVSDTRGNLSAYETSSWRWNSQDALQFDLSQAQLALSEDNMVSNASLAGSSAVGVASLRVAAFGSSPGILLGLGVGLLGGTAAWDANMRQGQIDALNARLAQIRAQAAGTCRVQ
jgi:RHS repeat-associated protein